MPVVAHQRAGSALRFLPQKTTSMEPFHAANFRAVLADFVDYVERDDVLSHLVTAVRRRATRTARDWNEESLRRSQPAALPEDGLACLALRHDLLRTAVKSDKFDLRYFVTCLFPGSHLNEKLMHWKRLVVHPLAADLRRLGELSLERLPAGEWVETDDVFPAALEALGREAFGPRAWTDADDEAATKADERARSEEKRSALTSPPRPSSPTSPSTTSSSPTSPSTTSPSTTSSSPTSPSTTSPSPQALASALAALDHAVERSGLDADARHDLALEVQILALEARRSDARSRLLSRLDAVATRPALREPAELVRRSLGPRL